MTISSTAKHLALCLIASIATNDAAAQTGDLIYIADQDTLRMRELYYVTIKTGVVTKLNGTLIRDGDVSEFQIGPKGKTVVYRADQDTDGMVELYHVALKTRIVTKLNGTLVRDGSVTEFQIGPQGRSVVYLADQDTDNVRELFHVNLKTGAVTKLNETLPTGGRVYGMFQFDQEAGVSFTSPNRTR